MTVDIMYNDVLYRSTHVKKIDEYTFKLIKKT